MPVYRASNLGGHVEFINPDDSTWLGPLSGGHYRPALHRTADCRWFAAFWTLAGYDGPPGRPLFAEVTADDAAGWFEANRIEIPAELVAALSAPPAARPVRTAEPTHGTNRAGQATLPRPAGASNSETIVADYLREHPDAKSPEISRETGIPQGTLRKLPAWKAHQDRRRSEKPADAMRFARPLSEAMLAVMPAKSDDPAELAEVSETEDLLGRIQSDAEFRGIVESQYLQTVDPSKRAEYNGASPAERILQLGAWKLTGMS